MDYTLFDKYLGEQLCEAREKKHVTRTEMAQKISNYLKTEKGKKQGISRQAYSFYETGQRSMPSSIHHYACIILGLDEIKEFQKANKKFMKSIENEIK